MELWIRSQDRSTLMKVNYIYVTGKEVCAYDENKCWSTIGTYKTKERALEVLGEIQTEISNYVGTIAQIVYEMPEE